MDYKKEIAQLLHKELKKDVLELLEIPPDASLGDYAFPCFSLAKELKKNPQQIAQELAQKLTADFLEKIEVKGAYLNFFVKKEQLTKDILRVILEKQTAYGEGKQRKEVIMIESPGPNTNKPLHLGHVRNMVLGNALANIFSFLGYKTAHVDIVNDRGIHICKSMLAYQKFGKKKQPDKKPDHFVGEFYVLYAKKVAEHPELEQKIYTMLQQWEENNKEVRALWKQMNTWASQGFKATYQRYGTKIDKAYFESDHYQKGKDVVQEGLQQGIFTKDTKSNIVADLTPEKLGEKVVLRADGTSIYITQDLVLAQLRYKEYHMHKMIYVVASEQIHHFKALFTIFKKFGFPFADQCYHLAYGMIYLPEGKMKSREGTVVDADELADQMHAIAHEEITKRHPKITKKELEQRSEAIGMAAIKFYMLKYDTLQDFTYDPQESISFEGETGPYLQYTYARLCSILRKQHPKDQKIDYSLYDAAEQELIKTLGRFPEIVEEAGRQYKPHLLARYLLDLGQAVNSYYTSHIVLQEDKPLEKARLALVVAVRTVLGNGLKLLGITALEEM